jgi:hypothetical protein
VNASLKSSIGSLVSSRIDSTWALSFGHEAKPYSRATTSWASLNENSAVRMDDSEALAIRG